MELVEGEGLDAVIARGPVPVDEAIAFALQITEGLEAAHEAGIVHRDLKPANVRVRSDGTVKVLDFGLAKAWESDPVSGSGSLSPTITRHHTKAGVLLGTAAYMAPEQARGKPVDKRADIWAFGVVLWEMLTGRALFDGETVSDVLAAVLTREVSPATLPEGSPVALRRLLARCLERDRRRRLHDAGDAALELLEATRERAGEDGPQPLPSPQRGLARRTLMWAAVAGAVVATVIAIWALTNRAGSGGVSAASIGFDQKTFDRLVIYGARFLPDGQSIVFSGALSGNRPELFLLPAGARSPRKLAPPGTHLVSVSADGELAVLTGATYINHRLLVGTLARMAVDGSPRPLVEQARDADWGPDGSMAIVRRVAGADRLEYPIGTVLYETSGYVSEPRVSADGERVAFLDHQWWLDDRGWLKVVDRAGHVTTLSEEFWAIEGLAWSGDGTTLFFSGAIGAPNLQPRAATLTGHRATRVFSTPGEFTVLDVNRKGEWLAMQDETRYGVVAHPPGSDSDIDLSWLDSSWGSSLSRDGQTLLFTNGRGGPNYSVVTRRLDGSPITTLGDGDCQGFSPDGRWVAAKLANPPGIVLYPTGAGSPRRLERGKIEQFQDVQWFPGGASLVFSGNESSRPVRMYRQSIDQGAPVPITPEGIAGSLRPDGAAILALAADDVWKLYPVDGGEPQPTKGLQPSDFLAAWNPEGSAVFVYRLGDVPAHIERVDLATGERSPALTIAPEQSTGLVRIWFSSPTFDPSQGYSYGYLNRLSQLYVVTGVGP